MHAREHRCYSIEAQRDIFIFDIWSKSKVAITLFLFIDLLCYRYQSNAYKRERKKKVFIGIDFFYEYI